MRLLTTDFSAKVLHVAVATKPSQLEFERMPAIHGIIYRPDAVFNKINTTSERLYGDLFAPGQIYQTVAVETEMGPGELGKMLEKKFKINYGLWVGGIIGSFTTDEVSAAELLNELVSNPQDYFTSEEKRVFA